MSESDPAEAPLDGVALGRLLALGGEPFLAQMIDIVLPQVETRLASARAGLEVGDAAAVRLAVHSLRSTAGNVGAARLMAAAAAAEDAAETGELAPLREAFAAVEAAWPPVRAALEARRKSIAE
jgi:HPt (histidine-containing phosphotransfer) domain-containing protein